MPFAQWDSYQDVLERIMICLQSQHVLVALERTREHLHHIFLPYIILKYSLQPSINIHWITHTFTVNLWTPTVCWIYISRCSQIIFLFYYFPLNLENISHVNKTHSKDIIWTMLRRPTTMFSLLPKIWIIFIDTQNEKMLLSWKKWEKFKYLNVVTKDGTASLSTT